jgi:acetyltransferase
MAVVSTSGGAGSTVTDLIDLRQLELADLAADTIEYLNDLLPEFAHAANPLDVTAEGAFSPSVIYESLRALCEDDAVDFVGVLLTSLADEHAVRAARQVADAASKTDKPILVCWLIASELAAEGMRILAEAGIRVFDEPTRMVDAARHLVDRGAYGDEWDE